MTQAQTQTTSAGPLVAPASADHSLQALTLAIRQLSAQLDQISTRLAARSGASVADQAQPFVSADELARYAAFTWQMQADGSRLVAIPQPVMASLDDLLGMDSQKQRMLQNMRQFMAGQPANNVLLSGARGTGKSSLVRAMLDAFAGQGLRLIEVGRPDLVQLPALTTWLQQQPYRFLIYCDDLAFEQEDQAFRALKTVLDGSLRAATGDNVLLCATSNRRHLLPEFMHENMPIIRTDGDFAREIHPQEAADDKLSLSDRFGLWLSFHSPDQADYLAVVAHGLQQWQLTLTDAARAEALRWAHQRGQRSGRVAMQFVRAWAGQQAINPPAGTD